jgi:hypothetical protein
MKIRVVLVRFLLVFFGRLRLRRAEPSASIGGSCLLSDGVANRREQCYSEDKPGQKPLNIEIRSRKAHCATSV